MEGSFIVLGVLEVILRSLAFTLGLHFLSCVCLSCLGVLVRPEVSLYLWIFGSEEGEDLLSITAVPGLPGQLWCFT